MSNDVENKVVSMTFDNSKFQQRMQQTLQGLKKLQEMLKLTEGAKGMKDVSKEFNKFDANKPVKGLERIKAAISKVAGSKSDLDLTKATNLDPTRAVHSLGQISKAMHEVGGARSQMDMAPVGVSVEGVSAKFLAMATVATTAIAGIVTSAASAGASIVKSFTISPIMDGFREYETNMGSIQTILANTQSDGTNLGQVEAALQKLNEYSDQTIYNFGEMARNIGTFTAAGVDLDSSVSAIKGIANLAAISGSSSEQASTAMYQLSQALAAGKVSLMDWNSVVNAGMGGEVFKSALFETGKALGKIKDVRMGETFQEWEARGNKFRDTLQDGWLTGEVLTNTLSSFTGELTEAQLLQMGYTKEQAAEMQRLGQLGVESATKVKTITQLIGTVKEAIGTGYADSFKTIIGDFEGARTLLTDANNAIGKSIGASADARNAMLKGWDVFGGREAAIDGLKNAFTALRHIIDPIRFAFRALFPKQTAAGLIELSNKFRDFTKGLITTGGTTVKLVRIFRGIFSVIKFFIKIVGGAAKVVGSLFRAIFGAIGGGGDKQGILSFLANIADFLTFITGGPISSGLSNLGLGDFFKTLQDGAAKIGGWLGTAIKAIAGFFGGILSGLGGAAMSVIRDIPGVLSRAQGVVVGFWNAAMSATKGIRETFVDGGQAVLSFFGGLIESVMGFDGGIGDAFNNVRNFISGLVADFQDGTLTIMGIIGGAGSAITDFFGSLFGGKDAKKGSKTQGDQIGGMVGGMNRLTQASEKTFKIVAKGNGVWDTFMEKIRGVQRLVKSAAQGITGSIRALFGGIGDGIASENFERVLGAGLLASLAKMGLDITGFFRSFGRISNSVANAVNGLRDIFEEFGDTMKAFQLKLKAEALLKIAFAIGVLAVSMIALSFLDPVALGLSLGSVTIGIAGLAGAMALLAKQGMGGFGFLGMGQGILLMAGALVVLAAAVFLFGKMDFNTLVQGMGSIGVALGLFAGAIRLMGSQNENVAKAGLAMLLMAGAMIFMARAIEAMGNIHWPEMIQGLVGVGGSLGVLIVAMRNMAKKDLTKAGIGMLLLSFSLKSLATAVERFGNIHWPEMIQGLVGLAFALGIIVIAMNKLPRDMVAKGLAMVALGAGLLAISAVISTLGGLNMGEIVQGLLSMAVALGVIVLAANGMSTAGPGAAALVAMAVGIKIIADVIGKLGNMRWQEIALGIGAIVLAMVAIGGTAALLGLIAPLIMAFGLALAVTGIGMLAFGAGVALLAAGIGKLVQVGRKGIPIFVEYIKEIIKALPEFLSTAAKAILQAIGEFLAGLPPIIKLLNDVFVAILDEVIRIMPKIFEVVDALLLGLLQLFIKYGPPFLEAGLGMLEQLLVGLTEMMPQFEAFGIELITAFINVIVGQAEALAAGAAALMLKFIEVLAVYVPAIAMAGADLIINLINGMAVKIPEFVTAVGNLIIQFINALSLQMEGIINAGANLIIKFVEGIGANIQKIIDKGVEVVLEFLHGVASAALQLAQGAADALIDFLEGLEAAIRYNDDRIMRAGAGVADAIIDGIVDAIEAGASRAVNAVKDLASKMLQKVKDVFDIASPSRAMFDIGGNLVDGLVGGIGSGTISGDALAESLKKAQEEAAKKNGASTNSLGTFSSEFELNPTITPVVDLSLVKMGAGKIDSMLDGATIGATASVESARLISAETNRVAEEAAAAAASGGDTTFNQYNYSPEALSTADIYRQSKGLLAKTKEELGIAS